MIAKRIISVLTVNDGVLFRTKMFQPDYRYTASFVDSWSIDEISMLDITRYSEKKNRFKFFDFVESFTDNCFVPLSVGGWIENMRTVKKLMRLGADKVIINSQAFKNPEIISQISDQFGSQAIIISIDTKFVDNNYYVCIDQGKKITDMTIFEWSKIVQDKGAGEIIVNSIEKDGWLQGYDLNLLKQLKAKSTIPIIALGGCGNWQHMYDAFTLSNVDAVATQNIFHFTEQSIKSAKEFLKNKKIHIRDC